MDAFTDDQPRARTIDLPARGGAVAALDFGPEERPVDIVFSHANGFNARTYRTILGPLAGELRILAFDLRGHGASTLPDDPAAFPGWTGIAADLVAVLEAATDRAVVLAGHSLGATTSLLAAGAVRGRVRSLALFEPVLLDGAGPGVDFTPLPIVQGALRRRADFPDRAAALEAYRGRGAFAGWSEAMLADYVAAGFRDRPEGGVTLACRPGWEAAIYARHDYDPGAALAAARCPMRIFAAEDGSTVGRAARSAAAAAGLGLEVVAGTTHFLPMQRPELVREALREAAR